MGKAKPRSFLSISDLKPDEIKALIEDAIKLKSRGWISLLKNKTLALLFEKPSLRTRVSFEMAMRQLGGNAIYLSPAEVGLGNRESIPDVARVLSRMVDGIACRTFAQETVEQLAEWGSIPVINALSDYEHPCQALADLQTIQEHKGKLKGLTLAYIGDGNNCAHSLMLACAMVGLNFRIASPKGFSVKQAVLVQARKYAKVSGSNIVCSEKPDEVIENADIAYTDTWTSMGQEAETKIRLKAFAGYQINNKLLALANKNVIVMHPLPAHHGEEVAKGLLDSKRSVVFDQAENRLHAQKAVLKKFLGE
ncbi:MAG: ornithine carbamoyltransferase [Chloroflexi bacterium RBG_13_46_9]|nr:MAG: ornithine carbamoyltransferase [Chloroflexi bacterium RBG_13_46_9]